MIFGTCSSKVPPLLRSELLKLAELELLSDAGWLEGLDMVEWEHLGNLQQG